MTTKCHFSSQYSTPLMTSLSFSSNVCSVFLFANSKDKAIGAHLYFNSMPQLGYSLAAVDFTVSTLGCTVLALGIKYVLG